MLSHEKLDVYQRSLEFLALVSELTETNERGDGPLLDQLRRASMSIPLNIAESSGRPKPQDRARFCGIARGSAMECNAILDVCKVTGRYSQENINRGKALLLRIVEMLSKMCR